MNDSQIEGAAREFTGRVKDTVGGFVGDAKTQASGKMDAVAGQVQQKYGQAVNAASDGIETISSQVREQPITALLIAGAIGWVIGRIGRAL